MPGCEHMLRRREEPVPASYQSLGEPGDGGDGWATGSLEGGKSSRRRHDNDTPASFAASTTTKYTLYGGLRPAWLAAVGFLAPAL